MKNAATLGDVTHSISINYIIYLLRYIGSFNIQINNKGHSLINLKSDVRSRK